MNDTDWILLDTETTGLTAPIFVVEIAAQRMRGWTVLGEPFRKLLNQNLDIPSEVSRVHGYTREILERDGEPALRVYREFAHYVETLPLVSYNLEYDLDEVLKPEWKRLGVLPIGHTGFCALRLAQRLLDPVPAGNCKLQTLRQYYRLPERGAHTALGDVQTVADLFANILRPVAEDRDLDTWEKIVAYAGEEWYPSRIAFGKHKGRCVWEAREDTNLLKWLKWLASSENKRTARMGRWYLQQLEKRPPPETGRVAVSQPAGHAVLIYVNPKLKELRELVGLARARLAEVEAAYTVEKAKVDAVQAALFKRLRSHYEKRDRLRLVVNYRKTYLETLLRQGEEEAERVKEKYQQAKSQAERDYQQVAGEMENKKELSPDEQAELTALWKKLVKLYHPDRFAHEPDKQATYEKLTAAINDAKDKGDLGRLREIAEDPHGFILRQGWATLDFSDTEELVQLRRLWESLESEILGVLEATGQLRESPEYELYRLTEQSADMLDDVVAKQVERIEQEMARFSAEADRLAEEIQELTTKPMRTIE